VSGTHKDAGRQEITTVSLVVGFHDILSVFFTARTNCTRPGLELSSQLTFLLHAVRWREWCVVFDRTQRWGGEFKLWRKRKGV